MNKYCFLLVLLILGCGGEDNNEVTNPTTLTISNQNDLITITQISLVGNDFNSLSIGYNQSKTFVLGDINGGYNGVNIKIYYDCGPRGWNENTSIDLNEGGSTTLTVKDSFPNGQGGCRDISFQS